jgi:rare lipoprotein A
MGVPDPRLVVRSPRLATALILATRLAGCATSRGAIKSPQSKELLRPVQTGYASWYGKPHHGRRTASGEIYDMNQLTATHPTLPMGTRLLVTNRRRRRSVEVRVNDRGPTVGGRILDLSYAAARELGAVGEGVIPVRIRVVTMPSR